MVPSSAAEKKGTQLLCMLQHDPSPAIQVCYLCTGLRSWLPQWQNTHDFLRNGEGVQQPGHLRGATTLLSASLRRSLCAWLCST